MHKIKVFVSLIHLYKQLSKKEKDRDNALVYTQNPLGFRSSVKQKSNIAKNNCCRSCVQHTEMTQTFAAFYIEFVPTYITYVCVHAHQTKLDERRKFYKEREQRANTRISISHSSISRVGRLCIFTCIIYISPGTHEYVMRPVRNGSRIVVTIVLQNVRQILHELY